LIIQFSAELRRAWQFPTFATAGLKRGETSLKTLGQFSMQAQEDLEVAITVEEQDNESIYCMITMQVNIPSRGGWPNLADIQVILKRDQEILASQVTDAYGEVVFEKIHPTDLTQLVFEITPEQQAM
jgi:hypothetical protein